MSAMELSAGFAATGLGAAISGGTNASYQLTTGEPFSYSDAFTAGVVGGLTQGKGFWVTEGVGLSGSYMGSVIKGEDPTYSLLGTAVGTTIGFKAGPIISEQLKPFVGESAAQVFGNMAGAGISEVVGGEVKSLGDK
jgi:filamentous hemagglutinin